MPKWNGLTLTNLGKNLQVKCQAGTQLQFTKVKMGDGIHEETETLTEQTELKSIRQNTGITECKVNDNNQCEISCIISNTGLETGYYLRELGLYANDPDLGEILYAITLDANPDFLPEDGGSVTLSETFNILISIGNITDVTAIIDVGGWATTGYVGQQVTIHDTSENAHYDMVGASAEKDGKRGFVPKPVAGNPKRCLRADGTWGIPDDTKYTSMQGASTTAAGKTGLVPQPRAGDNAKYLRGDGNWEVPALQIYPVGAIYLSVSPTSPAALFGGVWTQIKDRFLLAVGDKYNGVKQTGGEEKHTLTENEMPVHKHSAQSVASGNHTHAETAAGAHNHNVNSSGAHTHTRGTMNITGTGMRINRENFNGVGCSGAIVGTNTYTGGGGECGDGNFHSNTENIWGFDFDASRAWTGETSTAGNHTHTLSSANNHSHTINSAGEHNHTINVEATGGNQAHNNMPPYLTVYMWMRTA